MVTLHQDDDDALDATAAALRAGGVVVIPTDTVYGLAALPSHDVAVRAIYLAKGRPEGMHLPVLVASMAQARRLGLELTGAAEALADRWWPGPLTMVFGFSPRADRPSWLTAASGIQSGSSGAKISSSAFWVVPTRWKRMCSARFS